jgi:hypothetical protein
MKRSVIRGFASRNALRSFRADNVVRATCSVSRVQRYFLFPPGTNITKKLPNTIVTANP